MLYRSEPVLDEFSVRCIPMPATEEGIEDAKRAFAETGHVWCATRIQDGRKQMKFAKFKRQAGRFPSQR